MFSNIDRVLSNDICNDSFKDVVAVYLAENISDHFPCIVNIEANKGGRAKSFKFCNIWVKAEDFMSIVQAFLAVLCEWCSHV